MYRIAVCDDNPEILTQVCTTLSGSPLGKELELTPFHSGAALAAALRSGARFALLILDIELDTVDGVAIGRLLREELRDSVTQLLYISGQQQYAMALFDTRPLNFLLKPLDEAKLLDCVVQAIRLSRPEEAVPSHRLCELLRTLGTDAANRVVICSGRDSGTLEKWFGGLPVSLAAEHGAFYKDRGAWRCNIRPASWDPKLSALLEHFARKTPRSRIERKQTALAWHYREADSWLGQVRAQQLVDSLRPLCARLNLHILQGDKVVEIKSPRFTKGSETLRLLRQERYDFILALGDDTTDDDMFAALPPRALSIKIGNASEHARYNMPEQSEVVPLLELLARDRGSFDPAGVKHAIRTTWNNLKKLVAGRRTEEYGQ